MPAICQVSYAEELQCQCQLQERQCHLEGVHPAARFRQFLQYRWEHSKQREWQRQCNGKAQHTHRWCEERFACSFHEQGADDRTCARERYNHQCECHQQDAQETCGVARFAIKRCGP